MLNEAVFILDKPAGPTSFDMVRQIKKVYPKEKVGHAGTLDPFATGVLIILLGRATKFSDKLLNSDKTYRATLRLGVETDALDLTGKLVKEADIPSLSASDVEICLKSLEGTWEQTPPMFSAKKVQGVRLYELARKEITIPREKKPVQLYSLKLVEFTPPDITFEVHCSKGTYIRSLGKEIAEKLGTVGHLTALRRLSCGPFLVEKSLTLEQIYADPKGVRALGYENFAQLFDRSSIAKNN